LGLEAVDVSVDRGIDSSATKSAKEEPVSEVSTEVNENKFVICFSTEVHEKKEIFETGHGTREWPIGEEFRS
jgi:hypothetical protein